MNSGADIYSMTSFLFKIGKLYTNTVAFYGKANELTVGGYNETLFNQTDLFWVNTTTTASTSWSLGVDKILFDHREYSKPGLQAELVIEHVGIGLPQAIYEGIFAAWAECVNGTCELANDRLEGLPRFVLNFGQEKAIVIHPDSYLTKVSDTKYTLNVQKLITNSPIIIGGDILNRVYVILDASGKKVGLVNYDKDTPELDTQTMSFAIVVLLVAAAAIASISLVAGLIYYLLQKSKATSKDSVLISLEEEMD